MRLRKWKSYQTLSSVSQQTPGKPGDRWWCDNKLGTPRPSRSSCLVGGGIKPGDRSVWSAQVALRLCIGVYNLYRWKPFFPQPPPGLAGKGSCIASICCVAVCVAVFSDWPPGLLKKGPSASLPRLDMAFRLTREEAPRTPKFLASTETRAEGLVGPRGTRHREICYEPLWG